MDLQQERETETIVGTSLRRDDLSQRARNKLVSKGTLGYGLRQDRISASNARSDNKRSQEGKLGNCDENAQASADPHDCHHREEADRHLLPPGLLVLGRELESSDDQLHTDDNSAHALYDAQQGSILGFCEFALTSVIASCCPVAAEPHFSASRNLAAIGPRMTPMRTAGTVKNEFTALKNDGAASGDCVLTSFTKIPYLLDLD